MKSGQYHVIKSYERVDLNLLFDDVMNRRKVNLHHNSKNPLNTALSHIKLFLFLMNAIISSINILLRINESLPTPRIPRIDFCH